MSVIFKGLPPKPPKKHFVTIQGKQYQVSLKKKLEILQHGEENYMIKPAKFGPEILLKPKPKPKTRYSVLKNATKGYDSCLPQNSLPPNIPQAVDRTLPHRGQSPAQLMSR